MRFRSIAVMLLYAQCALSAQPPAPVGRGPQPGPTKAPDTRDIISLQGVTGPMQFSAYGYLYNQGIQVVRTKAPVNFNLHGPLNGIVYLPATAEIKITQTGTYHISFFVVADRPHQCALFVNGFVAPSTVVNARSSYEKNMGVAILALKAGDALTLRNYTSSKIITLAGNDGSPKPNVNAALYIEQIG